MNVLNLFHAQLETIHLAQALTLDKRSDKKNIHFFILILENQNEKIQQGKRRWDIQASPITIEASRDHNGLASPSSPQSKSVN
jgi:hypothetical protein